MPIENLRITIQNRRSIWKRNEEKRRKTTLEERKEIVGYCINHHRNYKDTALKFDVSYRWVYSWVKKYDVNGEDELTDRRGHHKTDDEADELERLIHENLRLKR